MKNRYKIPKSIQIAYLKTLEQQSLLSSEQLAKIFHVAGRSYRDWKRGKYPLPHDAITLIEKRFHLPFPVNKRTALNVWIRQKRIIAQKGAYVRLKKYGPPGTPEGRRIGGIHGLATLRKLGKAPPMKIFHKPQLSAQLAEFVGIMLGDGHVGDDQWSITLNAKKDKEYAIFCSHLVYDLFYFHPSVLPRKDCHVLVVGSGGKNFISYLRSIGLTAKNKVKEQIGVPQWITANTKFSISCLRGLMDTDGGIFTHTYSVHNKMYRYKKLCFANRSMPLLHFVFNTLQNLGYTPKIIKHIENKRVWLYNQQEVVSYLKNVNTSNQRLLRAYKEGCQSGNGAAC